MGDRPEAVLRSAIESAFQELINTKHLYQSVRLDWDKIKPLITRDHVVQDSWRNLGFQILFKYRWVFDSEMSFGLLSNSSEVQRFDLPPVSTYCARCKNLQPHNRCSGDQGTSSLPLASGQVFCIPLQCQGCKVAYVVFLVTRKVTQHGVKLLLTGRSEFEEIKVPDYIPKEQRPFYSQAIVAFNTGQVLPALFMLRTLIEQHMREKVENKDLRGEDLCDAYAAILSEEFKRVFPSFREVYERLSRALHVADADRALFEFEAERVRSHFRGKQAFDEAVNFKPKN
jgi:hypothetical protein